jgi:hypothetical protein
MIVSKAIHRSTTREGQGKKGSYRTIVLFRHGEKTFFVFGYPKSVLSNIKDSVLKEYKRMAKKLFGYSDKQIDFVVSTGSLIEITRGTE